MSSDAQAKNKLMSSDAHVEGKVVGTDGQTQRPQVGGASPTTISTEIEVAPS